MFVRRITIGKFRHLRAVDLGPFAQPPKQSTLIALAGPNGSGKSSILELLSHGLSQTWSLTWTMRRSFPESSFEIELGVTPDEIRIINEKIAEEGRQEEHQEILQHLNATGSFFRSFNYPEGEYEKNATLYNKTYGLVTRILRNDRHRALGFFLRSDRSYGGQDYRPQEILNVAQGRDRDHLWSMAFNTSAIQYKDMFAWLIAQRFHYDRALGATLRQRLRQGAPSSAATENSVASLQDLPRDPLAPYEELLNQLFPGYSFAEPPAEIPDDLYVRLPSDDTVRFGDLSSGEQEVFFIVSFFLRHNVSDAIVVLDEPELHLHPEFARLLVKTTREIQPGNQIWAATHNTEVIDEAGRDNTIYVARDSQTHAATVTSGTDEAEVLQHLRRLFGYSGYIGVARCLVFLEGRGASNDRKMLASLFPQEARHIRFIPSGGTETLARINRAVLEILESTLSWCQFYLVRDRDYLPDDRVERYREKARGRLHVLERNQIENYLLDESAIAAVERDVFSRTTTSAEVLTTLRKCARNISGQVLADMCSFRLNLVSSPQDFSMPGMLTNQSVVSDQGGLDDTRLAWLISACATRAGEVRGEAEQVLDDGRVEALVRACAADVRSAIADPGDKWRTLFPGKLLLDTYRKERGLGRNPVLQNCLIRELSSRPDAIPAELRDLMSKIAAGEPLPGT